MRLSSNGQETNEVTQAKYRCNDEVDTANLQISIRIVRLLLKLSHIGLAETGAHSTSMSQKYGTAGQMGKTKH